MTLFDRWARREQEAAEELPGQASDDELLAWGEALLATPDSDYRPRHLRPRPLRADPSMPRIEPLRAKPLPAPQQRPPRTEPLRAEPPLASKDVIIDLRDEVPQDPPFRRAWRARPLSVTSVTSVD